MQVICKGVAPLYYKTYADNIESDTGNGWILTCYNGIPQCGVSLVDGVSLLDTSTTATESTACMQDVRYMTWRAQTLKIDFDGTLSWYRIDSYWNAAASSFGSTWGTGVKLSTHPVSGKDNAGGTAANLGKTFVFAYSDCSGIQFNHISFGVDPVATNNSAGSGTNTLTSAPSSFTLVSPNMVNEQHCLASNLELTGTANTSGLSSTITAWSDGYKAKIALSLEMILPGAAGGWRGACLVYYSSQYVMDNTNGSVCFAAQASTATGAGPVDFGTGYLMHVASSTWQPPANKASV